MYDIEIGTKFIRIGRKENNVCTVVDIYKTYNSKNELVKTAYLCEWKLLDNTIRDEFCKTTILRGLEQYGYQ